MEYSTLNKYKDICLMITNRCNLVCGHCSTKFYGGKDMMREEIFDSLNLNINDNIQLYGGEPMLNHELIKYILSKGYKRVYMVTNNTFLLEKFDFISRLNYILLSLNNGKTVNNLIKNVNFLLSNNINFGISAVISDLTIDTVCKFIEENLDLLQYLYPIPDVGGRISEDTLIKWEKCFKLYLNANKSNTQMLEYNYGDNGVMFIRNLTYFDCKGKKVDNFVSVEEFVDADITKPECKTCTINCVHPCGLNNMKHLCSLVKLQNKIYKEFLKED